MIHKFTEFKNVTFDQDSSSKLHHIITFLNMIHFKQHIIFLHVC